MANAYFFNNETKDECIYVKNTGTYQLEIDTLVRRICQSKKWETSDRVIVMLMNTQNLVTYVYQNDKFDFLISKESKYDCIEIESNEVEIQEDNFDSENDSEDYSEYDDYNYDMDLYDDRYDERDDDYGYDGGYEDEFYECCDMY